MRDQEKSDFLKAKILAEKGLGMQPEVDDDKAKNLKALEKAKTVDALGSLFSYIIGIVTAYFTQAAILPRLGTATFGFWEVVAIYTFCTTSINFLSKSIKSIFSARTKI